MSSLFLYRMSRLFWVLILTFVSINLFSETNRVSLAEATTVADANAAALWGKNLSKAEPIPYYGPGDEIIAWQFNYAIDKVFPTQEELSQRSKAAFQTDHPDYSWGDNAYANMVVGANRSMPVFIQYSQCLSEQYVLAALLDKYAREAFPIGHELEKIYYFGPVNIWYCVTDKTTKQYINLAPPKQTISEEEFREYINNRTFFWEDNDFKEEWSQFLDDHAVMDYSRSYHVIPGESYMPYIQWSYGCTPCSASMVFAWWDYYQGYGKLIDYYFTRWDVTQEDYDDHVPSILPLLADFMDTETVYGFTAPFNVDDGVIDAAEHEGYTFNCDGYWGLYSDDWFFDDIMEYIDNDTPCLAGIDPGFLDYHTVAAVGYSTSPKQIHVHDPNHSTYYTYTYAILEYDYYIYPEDSPRNKVRLLSPHGGTNWNNNEGGNEELHSGDYFEIEWYSIINADSTYVKLFYHPEGGASSDDWIPICLHTENDGAFDWHIPDIDCVWGTSTDYGRVKIELYDGISNQLLAQEGSFGNFHIYEGGSLEQLSDIPVQLETDPDYYSADLYETDTWYAIGVKQTDYINTYWKIKLYDDTEFGTEVGEAYSWDRLNYLVVDNYHVSPNEYGVKLNCTSDSSGTTFVQKNGDPYNELSMGSNGPFTWNANDVVRIWNVYLTPGDYYFELSSGTTLVDLDIALFKWGGDGIFNSEEAVASAEHQGLSHEAFLYSPISAGYYGLCVSERSEIDCTYTVNITSAGRWSGTVSTSWFNPDNWYEGVVPSFDNDIVIPNGCPHYPVINEGWGNAAYSKTLSIHSYANVTVADGYLNVYGDLYIMGNLQLTNYNSGVDVEGNVTWGEGSTAFAVDGSTINCYKNWHFTNLSAVHLDAGNVVFVSSNDSYIECDATSSYFHNLKLNKLSGAQTTYSELSSADLKVTGDLNIQSGSTLYSNSVKQIVIYDLFVNNGNFQFDNGTVKFAGDHAYLECNPGDYFHNLDISTVHVTGLLTDLMLTGDLTIHSGGILASSHHIYVGGSWYNYMGMSGFNKGTSTITFNGNDQCECTGGDFYMLELSGTSCELHFDTGVSSCDYFNWADGVLYIDGGTLTILDMVGDGIPGRTYVYSGTLELHQDAVQTVNLNGELHIHGGTVNVYGGTNYSYWPGTHHTWLEMSGGVLDFKNVGININDSFYLLTADLSGGVIRTPGNIYCDRFDFLPEAGSFEMYGTTDKTIYFTNQGNLPNLIINKTATRNEDFSVNPELVGRNENLRTNTVTITSDLNLTGDLIITSGSFNLNGHSVDVGNSVDVYDNLVMADSLDILSIGRDLHWFEGATGSITSGEIYLNRDFSISDNATFQAGLGNTFRFVGPNSSSIENQGIAATMGYVVLDKTEAAVDNAGSTSPLNIAGDLTINETSSLYISTNTINVSGNVIAEFGSSLYLEDSGILYVAGDFSSSGENYINAGDLVCHNNFILDMEGILTIQDGNVILDKSYTGALNSIAGFVQLQGGVFEITNNGIQFGEYSQFYQSGGVLKVGWAFKAIYPSTFQPGAGSVEFIGARSAQIECNSGNYFYNLVFNKPGTNYAIYFMTDIQVNNDLDVQGGNPNLFHHILTVHRDINISGGRLSATNADDIIYAGRNWSNTYGVTGFAEGNGTVNFVSDLDATISTENFNLVYVIKELQFPDLLTINSGATVTIDSTLNINSGCLKLDEGSVLNVNGDININANDENVSGLNISSAGTVNTLYLAGNLTDNSSIIDTYNGFFTYPNSTVVFDGSGDQILSGAFYNMNFYNVTVAKSAGRVMHSNNLSIVGDMQISAGEWSYAVSGKEIYFYKNLIIETPGSFTDSTAVCTFYGNQQASLNISGIARFSTIHILKDSGTVISLSGNATIADSTNITFFSGLLNLNGYTLKMKGTLTMYNDYEDCTLFLDEGSILNLGGNSVVSLGLGADLICFGTEVNPAMITGFDGFYTFTAGVGADLAVEHTVFEKMDFIGINIEPGAMVDSLHCFTGCTFQNGVADGTLLSWNPSQDLIIHDAVFPANTWGSMYNVSRYNGLGSVYFMNFTGAFAGSAFEYDLNDNIFWELTAPPDTPQNLQISYSTGEIILTWNAVIGATGYRIYRSFMPDVEISGELVGDTDLTTWSDESVIVYPEAFYLVKAYIE